MSKTPFRVADGAYNVTAIPKHTSIMPLSDKMPLKPGGVNPFGPRGPNYIVPPPLSRVERMGRAITEGLDRARRSMRPHQVANFDKSFFGGLTSAMKAAEPPQ